MLSWRSGGIERLFGDNDGVGGLNCICSFLVMGLVFLLLSEDTLEKVVFSLLH